MLYALISALPPVAQPLDTLMNGTPVRPRSLTSVSAAPAADEPPNAYSHVGPVDAGVLQGAASGDGALVAAR